MGVKGNRQINLEDEPSLLGDVTSIINSAKASGFINDYEVDIEEIVKGKGIILKKDKDMPPSMSGSLSKKNGKWIIKVNANHHPKRQRFTIAHEFAHFCLHADERASFVDEEIYFRKSNDSAIEFNADSFASEILMPEYLFIKAIREDGIKKVKELADHFNVSKMAIELRAKKLNFITKSNEK